VTVADRSDTFDGPRTGRIADPTPCSDEGSSMIWHIVRLDMGELDEATRVSIEDELAALGALDDVAWLRLARDIEDPSVTGLITVFADHDALERYRVHPDHVPVVQRMRGLAIPAVRIDIATDDDPTTLP
jgi:hypothetical protein